MSGVAKGVKKVFKKVGQAVKKVMKNKFFRAILIGAAAIFTGGAALGAFGALGANATLGSVASAAWAGGTSALGSVVSGITGAAKNLFGIGSSGASTATGAAEAAASTGGMTEGLGAVVDATGGLETATSAASNFVPSATEAASSLFPEGMSSTLSQAPQQFNLSNFMSQSQAPISTATQAAGQGSSWGGSLADYAGKAWDFIKPETAAGKQMWGQVLLGAGQGYLQGRAADKEMEYRRRMTEVPTWNNFELKPNHSWSLMGK